MWTAFSCRIPSNMWTMNISEDELECKTIKTWVLGSNLQSEWARLNGDDDDDDGDEADTFLFSISITVMDVWVLAWLANCCFRIYKLMIMITAAQNYCITKLHIKPSNYLHIYTSTINIHIYSNILVLHKNHATSHEKMLEHKQASIASALASASHHACTREVQWKVITELRRCGTRVCFALHCSIDSRFFSTLGCLCVVLHRNLAFVFLLQNLDA